MRGNHLFGIFSPEKLKKVFPRTGLQGPGRSWRCGGITFSAFSALKLFGIFSPEKLKKVIPPYRAPGGPGRSPDAGDLFGKFSALKSSKSQP